MKASYHVAVSAGVACGFHSMFQSWPATIGCFLSGVLIDLDHYLEFYIFRKRIPFRYQDLLDFCQSSKDPKVFLFFHGYEYLLIFWISIIIFHLNIIYVGVALGLTIHISFDQFTNPVKPLFYFIVYRFVKKFDKRELVKNPGHTKFFLQASTNQL